MTFLQTLADKGIIIESQMADLMRLADDRFGGNVDQALVSAGIDEADLVRAKSEFYSIPVKDVSNLEISRDTLAYIPEQSIKHYRIAPLEVVEGVLHVGVVDPGDSDVTDAIQFIASKNNIPFKLFLITDSYLQSLLTKYQGLTGEVGKALSEFDADAQALSEAASDAKPKEVGKKEDTIVEEAPVIKIVGVILRHATEGNASDIHIENVGPQVKVRFRVDGTLHTSLTLPLDVYNGVVARIKILAKLRLDEKRKPQDGGFSVKINGRKIDFRVSTFPTYNGEKVVMRILDQEKGVKRLDDLDLSPRYREMIKKALERPYGLIIISGPTGSGKSTTVYAMLNELDREGMNVVSLEDPIEYQIDGVSQSQVMPEIGYTFETGLRSILRQDPDVIMVGEMRDKETAQLAIQAALTGHLVVTTLHTNNSVGVVPRLVDMGIDPYLIAPTLILSIAQRLARRTCPESQQEVPFDESMQMLFAKQFQDLPETFRQEIQISNTMIQTVPSNVCPDGTKGRMAIFEMFEIDPEMQHIILTNPIEPELFKSARNKGMLTMKEDAMLKAVRGGIPIQEIYKF